MALTVFQHIKFKELYYIALSLPSSSLHWKPVKILSFILRLVWCSFKERRVTLAFMFILLLWYTILNVQEPLNRVMVSNIDFQENSI